MMSNDVEMMDCIEETSGDDPIIQYIAKLPVRSHNCVEEYNDTLVDQSANILRSKIKSLFIWIHSWGCLHIEGVSEFKMPRSDVIAAVTNELVNFEHEYEALQNLLKIVMEVIEKTKSELDLTSSQCMEKMKISVFDDNHKEKMFDDWTNDEVQLHFNSAIIYLFGCITFQQKWKEQLPLVNSDLMILYIFAICQINMSTFLSNLPDQTQTITTPQNVSIHLFSMMIVDALMDRISSEVWVNKASQKTDSIMKNWFNYSKLYKKNMDGHPTAQFYEEVFEFINLNNLHNYSLDAFLLTAHLSKKTRIYSHMGSFFSRLKIKNYSTGVYQVIDEYIQKNQLKEDKILIYDQNLILNILKIDNLLSDIEQCSPQDVIPGFANSINSLKSAILDN